MITDTIRRDLTPQGYIRRMFAETENGEFRVEYKDPMYRFCNDIKYFQVNWSEEDVEKIIEKYNLLTFALARIGRLHDQLDNEENRKKLLSESDLEIWNTYVRPYEPLEVDWDELDPIPPCEPDDLMSLIYETHDRAVCGDIIEQEELLLKQFYMWEEEQSQKRIPFNRRSCANLINRAMRFEKLISLGAPEIVVTEEGRCLAEEMVLYYFGKEQPIVWE